MNKKIMRVLTVVVAALTVCVGALSAQAIPANRTCETVEHVSTSIAEILNGLGSAAAAIAAVPGMQKAGLLGFGLFMLGSITPRTAPSMSTCDRQWLEDQFSAVHKRLDNIDKRLESIAHKLDALHYIALSGIWETQYQRSLADYTTEVYDKVRLLREHFDDMIIGGTPNYLINDCTGHVRRPLQVLRTMADRVSKSSSMQYLPVILQRSQYRKSAYYSWANSYLAQAKIAAMLEGVCHGLRNSSATYVSHSGNVTQRVLESIRQRIVQAADELTVNATETLLRAFKSFMQREVQSIMESSEHTPTGLKNNISLLTSDLLGPYYWSIWVYYDHEVQRIVVNNRSAVHVRMNGRQAVVHWTLNPYNRYYQRVLALTYYQTSDMSDGRVIESKLASRLRDQYLEKSQLTYIVVYADNENAVQRNGSVYATNGKFQYCFLVVDWEEWLGNWEYYCAGCCSWSNSGTRFWHGRFRIYCYWSWWRLSNVTVVEAYLRVKCQHKDVIIYIGWD